MNTSKAIILSVTLSVAVVVLWLNNSVRAATGVYGSTVIADGAVAYYPMDETSGSSATDVVGGNTGTYFGSFTLSTAGPRPPSFNGFDPTNNGVSFDGSVGSDLDIASISGLTANYSMEVWFNLTTINDLKYLLGRGSGASLQYDSIATFSDQLLFFNGNGAEEAINLGPALSTGQWYDLVFTRSGSSVDLYLNGVNIYSGSATATFGASTRITAAVRPGDSLGTNVDGVFDELSVYNTALTSAQIAAQYNIALVAPEPASLGLAAVGGLLLLRRRRA